MKYRENSIDMLRGLAILGMVLSGSITQTDALPGWMYHVQVGPPHFIFTPNIPGISWVDLVFPFFLFSMGLSIPFSLNPALEKSITTKKLFWKWAGRSFKLFLFAIALPHLSFYGLAELKGWPSALIPLMGFAGFTLAFAKLPVPENMKQGISVCGYALLAALILVRTQVYHLPFSFQRNDIIILVLANMAFAGPLLWWLTRNNPSWRLAIMVLITVMWLSKDISSSFAQIIWHETPLKALGRIDSVSHFLSSLGVDTEKTLFFSMNFMKYLLIVLPGTFIGDMAYQMVRKGENWTDNPATMAAYSPMIITFLVSFTPIVLIGSYTREILPLTLGILFMILLWETFFIRHEIKLPVSYKKWIRFSFLLLIAGILVEPTEGGIKKDPATLSYIFTTSGLGGLLLLACKMSSLYAPVSHSLKWLVKTGQNPMVGYVAVAFVIVPLLQLSHTLQPLDIWGASSAFGALSRGILLTTLMVLLTKISVTYKLFWKT